MFLCHDNKTWSELLAHVDVQGLSLHSSRRGENAKLSTLFVEVLHMCTIQLAMWNWKVTISEQHASLECRVIKRLEILKWSNKTYIIFLEKQALSLFVFFHLEELPNTSWQIILEKNNGNKFFYFVFLWGKHEPDILKSAVCPTCPMQAKTPWSLEKS